jgi:hypothetical protein
MVPNEGKALIYHNWLILKVFHPNSSWETSLDRKKISQKRETALGFLRTV